MQMIRDAWRQQNDNRPPEAVISPETRTRRATWAGGATSIQHDLSGIGSDPRPDSDLRNCVERQLADLLRAEGIPPRAVYRSGEMCRLLRILRSTLLALRELAEDPAARRAHPRALDSLPRRSSSPHFACRAGGMAGAESDISA